MVAAQPNYIYRSHATTNDPRLEEMWQLNLINVPVAWDTTTGDPNVVIAIVDTGNLSEHPELVDRVRRAMTLLAPRIIRMAMALTLIRTRCHSPITARSVPSIMAPMWPVPPRPLAIMKRASLVSHTAELMHIRVLDGRCGGSPDVAQGVLYAIGAENDSGEVPERPADIVNMSLGGGGYDPFFESVLQDADERGVIVAVSSGNDGASSVGYPARYATTIAVGSVGFDGEVTSYSNRGENLDLVAPGVERWRYLELAQIRRGLHLYRR